MTHKSNFNFDQSWFKLSIWFLLYSHTFECVASIITNAVPGHIWGLSPAHNAVLVVDDNEVNYWASYLLFCYFFYMNNYSHVSNNRSSPSGCSEVNMSFKLCYLRIYKGNYKSVMWLSRALLSHIWKAIKCKRNICKRPSHNNKKPAQ